MIRTDDDYQAEQRSARYATGQGGLVKGSRAWQRDCAEHCKDYHRPQQCGRCGGLVKLRRDDIHGPWICRGCRP